MGKPRMILLIRHAQSEGNKNRDIHQYIPDHRVKLTADGVLQAEDAGRRLRSMLKPDDTLQFFTSPYRRTRETTDSILHTLTSDDPEQGPSPFHRNKITVYEEPRLREQDFGNFQPCSAEMERMWQERADYGHFFYRIPNGESAADAYDRVSGFNESLWRQFGDPDFPSVCVLVTHGLMTRTFLMKWYHWSVEYFEDLRNINHTEIIVMKLNPDNGKYLLENEMRTWSDLKRRAAANEHARPKEMTPAPSRKWGGCVDGCDHHKFHLPQRPRRQNTSDYGAVPKGTLPSSNEKDDHPIASQESNEHSSPVRKKILSSKSLVGSIHLPTQKDTVNNEGAPLTPSSSSAANEETDAVDAPSEASEDDSGDAGGDEEQESESSPMSGSPRKSHHTHRVMPLSHRKGHSGPGTALADMSDEGDESDFFDTNIHQMQKRMSYSEPSRSSLAQVENTTPGRTSSLARKGSSSKLIRRNSASKMEKQWQKESGMTVHKRADALGDVDEDEDAEETVQHIEDRKEKERASLSEVY